MGGMRCMRYGRDDEHARAEAWGRPSHPSHRIFYYLLVLTIQSNKGSQRVSLTVGAGESIAAASE